MHVNFVTFESNIDETTEVKTVTMVAEIALTIDVMGIVTVAIEIGAADMGETVTTIAGGVIATAVMAETATMIAEEVIDTMIAEGVIDTMIAEVATASTIVEVEIVMVTEIEGVIMMTAKEAHGVTLTVVVIQGATLIETKESLVRVTPCSLLLQISLRCIITEKPWKSCVFHFSQFEL